jgi:hypothetical protein
VLDPFPIGQRIFNLAELLADKPETAPEMEPAYETCNAVLQKEFGIAKLASDHAAQISKC